MNLEKALTYEELSKHNGLNPTMPIYISVKHFVFDVSTRRDLYADGGVYNIFSGKDISRALAKESINITNFSGNLEGLTPKEMNRLENALNKIYLPNYPIVAKLISKT